VRAELLHKLAEMKEQSGIGLYCGHSIAEITSGLQDCRHALRRDLI